MCTTNNGMPLCRLVKIAEDVDSMLRRMLTARLGGRHYISDKISLLCTLLFGLFGGAVRGSFYDLLILNIDPIYPSPYRTAVDTIAFLLGCALFVALAVWYLFLCATSKHLSVGSRLLRLLLTLLIGAVLAYSFSQVWLWAMRLLHILRSY